MKLLINPENNTYYALPEDLLVPSGDVALVDLQGNKVSAHLPALEKYARTQEEVKADLKASLEATAQEFNSKMQLIRTVAEPGEQEKMMDDLIPDLLGMTEEDRKDPRKMAEAQAHFRKGFFGAMAAFNIDNLEDVELPDNMPIPEIDLNSAEFKQAAQKLGPKMDELLEDPRAQASMEKLFAQVTTKFQNDPAKMEQFVERMDALHEKLYGEEEAKAKEKREAEIRASARSAIENALRARGIRPSSTDEPNS